MGLVGWLIGWLDGLLVSWLVMYSARFTKVDSDCSYDCTLNTVNVFDTGITLHGRSDLGLAAATPCRLQLCAVCGNSAGKSWYLGKSRPSKPVPYSGTLKYIVTVLKINCLVGITVCHLLTYLHTYLFTY